MLAFQTLVGAGGCTSDEWPPVFGESEGASTGMDVDFSGASLVVLEPEAASIHRIGEPIPLVAQLQDIDGFPLDGAEVVWKRSDSDEILVFGPEGDVELDAGSYDLSAFARLPDGSKLETKVGDVRVQSRWAGIYAGNAVLDLELTFQDMPLNPRCSGNLEMEVGFDGSMVTLEEGSCVIDVVVTQLALTFTIDGSFEDGVGQGEIVYDIAGFLQIPFEWRGAFIEDGFGGSFGGPTELPLIGEAQATGTLSARLLSPYVEE